MAVQRYAGSAFADVLSGRALSSPAFAYVQGEGFVPRGLNDEATAQSAEWLRQANELARRGYQLG